MFEIKEKEAVKIEAVTFAELKKTESDIEELLRNNIEMLCEDEESMLIVGRQVRNESGGQSDLTAVDHDGNIVLIEIKRDKRDITTRREPFEFQAIRYAASYATLITIDDLVTIVYANYIDRYKEEFALGDLTPHEFGTRKLRDFLSSNGVESRFNQRQRIILVASEFDNQTLSAVAWLNSNNVDISCYTLVPYSIDKKVFVDVVKILPLSTYNDYYVDILDKATTRDKKEKKRTRTSKPKIKELIENGVIKVGDVLIPKGKNVEGTLCKNGNILVDGNEQSLQEWLKGVYEWSSVATYDFLIHKQTGRTLSGLRDEYMTSKKYESIQN